MNSRLLAQATLDSKQLKDEIDHVLAIKTNNEYSEFVCGAWSSCVLRNPTGDEHDAVMRVYDGPPRDTRLASQFPLILKTVSRVFNEEHLRWLRVFIFNGRGKLLPHKDFLEVERAYTRLHLPLQTNPLCMHSEEDKVFHMRTAEVWYLNTSHVHSACNLSDEPRLSLVLDFSPGIQFEELLKLPLVDQHTIRPCMIERTPFGQADLERIYLSADCVSADNFVDLLWALAEVHFHYQVSCRDMFDWLMAIVARCPDESLVRHCQSLRRFFIEERSMQQQFALAPANRFV